MNHRTISKLGFNLIEIAIVLAVIGLVIGGIYIAASAVTENNRRLATSRQLLQILQNVKTVFATQARYTDISFAQAKAMQIFPGDMGENSGNYLNAYGGAASISTAAGNDQSFIISFDELPPGACVSLLSKNFGSAAVVSQLGLSQLRNVLSNMDSAEYADGISVLEASNFCRNPSNYLGFQFNLRS